MAGKRYIHNKSSALQLPKTAIKIATFLNLLPAAGAAAPLFRLWDPGGAGDLGRAPAGLQGHPHLPGQHR